MDGSFIYTPGAGFTGTESFNYTVRDSSGLTDTGRVTFTVVPNAAPVATGDAYSLDEDTILTIAAPGLLVNDSDANGDALSAILVDDVTNGSLTLNADGSFNYTPDPNFNGPDSFTYKTNDGLVDGNTVTVDLTVNPVDDPEAIVGDVGAGAVTWDREPWSPAVRSASPMSTVTLAARFRAEYHDDPGYGTFSINADGDWQFILDNSSSQVQALADLHLSEREPSPSNRPTARCPKPSELRSMAGTTRRRSRAIPPAMSSRPDTPKVL